MTFLLTGSHTKRKLLIGVGKSHNTEYLQHQRRYFTKICLHVSEMILDIVIIFTFVQEF